MELPTPSVRSRESGNPVPAKVLGPRFRADERE